MTIPFNTGESVIVCALCSCDKHKLELKDVGSAVAGYMKTHSERFGADGVRIALFFGYVDERGDFQIRAIEPPS